MAISWYEIASYCKIGIDWCATVSDDTVKLAPKVYRYDEYRTDNYGGSFDEYLSPDPTGTGAWYDLGFGSGSGTRTIDSFATRTYTKTHSSQTVSFKIAWENIGSYSGGFKSLGSGSKTWTYTVPALASYSVKYNANGGSGAPSAQTKWYGETLTLSSTKPTRTGYTFQGWGTSSTDTSVDYAAGANYTANKTVTLYAIWKVVAPAAPSGVTVTRNSDTKNTVSWTRGSNADITYSSIKVERRVDGGSWSEIESVKGTATSYADTTTSADHYYEYRIRAYNTTGYSSYATCSTVLYNTPSAPTKVEVARSGETTVDLTITNASNTANGIEVQRSSDMETILATLTAEGSPVTVLADNPGGGTFYYRARNTRGSLASAWSAWSEPVVTICAPAAPTLVIPASGSVVNKADASIRFEWIHNPIDGSAQTGYWLQYSTDAGSTWTDVKYPSSTASAYAMESVFEVNSTVTWRVCTKGAHADYGAWSDTRVFNVYQAPSVSFAQPADGFVVENTPVVVELQYDDPSGILANATISISDGLKVVYTRNMGTDTECEILATEWLPDDGSTYTLTVSVRSSSTLTAIATREIAVSFVLPQPSVLDISVDSDTGYVSLVANIDEVEGLEVPVSIAVYRVHNDERVLLGEDLQIGAGLVDKYAPLNVDYTYLAVTQANSGALNSQVYPNRVRSIKWFLYYEGNGMASAIYNPESDIKLSRPGKKHVHYAGRKWPVSYDGYNVSDERSLSASLFTYEEMEAFRQLMYSGGRCVFKSYDGDVFHADVDVSLKPDFTTPNLYGSVSLSITRIDGGEL